MHGITLPPGAGQNPQPGQRTHSQAERAKVGFRYCDHTRKASGPKSFGLSPGRVESPSNPRRSGCCGVDYPADARAAEDRRLI